MKKIILILFISFLILVMLFLLVNRVEQGVRIHGVEEGRVILFEGGILNDLLPDNPIEILVSDGESYALRIENSAFGDFEVSRERGRLWLKILSSGEKLIEAKDIFLKTTVEDFGIYHLRGTEQIFFYDIYATLLEELDQKEEIAGFYRRGMLSIPDVFFVIGTDSDSLLFVYDNGREIWKQPSADGTIKIKREDILPAKMVSKGGSALKVIWEEPPAVSALDIYDILINSVGEDKTMAIFIDGLGFKLWEYAESGGYTAAFPDAEIQPMRSVYPPRTIYNYYAFGTGRLLQDSVEERKEIFVTLPETGKRGIIIEGEMQVYASPLEQVLHPRRAGKQGVDEFILETVLEVLDGYDFIFIHFHDIDYFGHTYGARSDEVLEAVNQTGEYVSLLRENFSGQIFLFSDHGMHDYYDEDEGVYRGRHYTGKIEDITAIFSELRRR